MSSRDSALRTDLYLRTIYPWLQTRVFELTALSHVIWVSKEELNATEKNKWFNNSVKAITQNISLTNVVPKDTTELSPLSDRNIPNDFKGGFVTEANLKLILAGKFPSLPILRNTKILPTGELEFYFCDEIKIDLKTELLMFLQTFSNGRETKVVDERIDYQPSVGQINGSSVSPIYSRGDIPQFIKEEEHDWFENADSLFQTGRSASRSILNGSGFSCFIDASQGSLDLRQALICYDTVFLNPPVLNSTDFWENQNISREDLIYLITQDRVRLIHKRPVERHDLGFLREAYECNPTGVIGMRGTSSIVISDAINTADNYVFGAKNELRQTSELVQRFAAEFNIPLELAARVILFPIAMRRSAFSTFTSHGVDSYGYAGIGDLFTKFFKKLANRDVMLEAGLWGTDIHLAHSFRSTYIPNQLGGSFTESWLGAMNLMGTQLNLYSSLNKNLKASWAINDRRVNEKREVLLPPIPLFHFTDGVPISELVDVTALSRDRRKGRSLVQRLSNLSPDLRAEEIVKIQNDLWTYRNKVDRNKMVLKYGGGAMSVGGSLYGVPTYGAGVFLGILLSLAKRSPSLERVIEAIEYEITPQNNPKHDLDFLSKVERVASISNIF